MNLYKNNLLFRSHPRGLVYVAAVSLILIGHIRTTCRPKPGGGGGGGGGGGAGAAVISAGSPFYRENAPVGVPEPEMTPPPEPRSY